MAVMIAAPSQPGRRALCSTAQTDTAATMSNPTNTPASPPWPNVPACYDWLSLDRRGTWRLRGEAVIHAGLRAFLDRYYGHDDAGNWFVQNGPQKVYAALDYMPLVLRLQPDGSLHTHAGDDAGAISGVWLDEEGNMLLATAAGPALVDDRDLAALLAECQLADGSPASDEALLAALEGQTLLRWRDLPVQTLSRADAPAVFRFNPAPRAS